MIADHTSKVNNDNRYVQSGVISKAGYLIAEGGLHYGVKVEGIGTDKLAKILYHTITHFWTGNNDFKTLRSNLIQSATELFGSNGKEVQAVTKAFDAVGVK